MRIMNFMKKFALAISLFLFSIISAQTLGSKLEKKTLALGEVDTFIINISNLQGKKEQIAPKNELPPFHFEEIKVSTSVLPDFYERTITFSVYETGKFTIPALDIKIGNENYTTIPYQIEVLNTANKDDEISDIFNNKVAKLTYTDYWELYKWYVYGFLLLIAIIFAVIFIIKYAKKQKSAPKVNTNQTLKKLSALKKKKFIEENKFRAFYVELLDISRDFITAQYHIPADVLLTDDLIDIMKKTNSISAENEKIIEEIFLRGDMVKFAKTFPDQATMQQDFDAMKSVVQNSVKDIEIENLRNGV